MQTVTITHSIRQIILVLAGFVVGIALLEPDGLASWASHLEIGPLRTVAVPVTGQMQKLLDPLGVPGLREQVLENLARVGWVDDPALLAKAAAATGTPDVPRNTACAPTALANPASAGTGPAVALPPGSVATPAHSAFPNAAGAKAPLLSDVPRTTALAPLPSLAPGRPRVVALAGDSMMAVGLSAVLMRQAAGSKDLRIVKAFRSGTGLARPEVFNWMDEYPAMLGAERPDVVIVAIGANDGQGFVVDGKVLAYGSEDWRRVYQDRLASYLAMVGATGARVLWMGLPPMRAPSYDEKIATINRIAYTVVSQQPNAAWFNPVSYVGDDAGRFREFVTLGNGKTMRIRSADGIHLSDEGAGLLTHDLMKWLVPPPPPPPAGTVAPAPTPTPVEQRQPLKKSRHRVHKAIKG